MKLLFITQKLHGQDAFTILWIEAFVRLGYDVTVLCLEWRPEEARTMLGRQDTFPFRVVSLGKERGVGKFFSILRFWRAILFLSYDRVFIHMTPVWGLLGAPVWIVTRAPVYLWYTHYQMQMGLRLLHWYARRLFCATPQSMPQYEGSAKKVVVGHGIDLSFWPQRPNHCSNSRKLLVVHRLSRSKRLEIVLHALHALPGYSLDVYGVEAEPEYAQEMKSLTQELSLHDRVTFHGSIPMKELPALYQSYRLILNMASETIDKTMLEAMTCGCYPITTPANAVAIGLPTYPVNDSPNAIVAFVKKYADAPPLPAPALYRIVQSNHSLESLMNSMDVFIRSAT